MNTVRQHQSRSKPHHFPGDQGRPIRPWLLGAASIALVSCAVAMLLHPGGTFPKTSESTPTDSANASVGMGDQPNESRDPALGAFNSSPNPEPLPLQIPVQAADAVDNQSPELDASVLSDPATLRLCLGSDDPVIADAALRAISHSDREFAERALLDIVSDGAEPRRLEVLQRLCASPDVDAETKSSVLRAALQDLDYGLVSQAVQELSGRSDARALGLLADALDNGDPSTKQLILQSVAGNPSAEPILLKGLKDSDDTVRNTARGVLSLISKDNAATKPSSVASRPPAM